MLVMDISGSMSELDAGGVEKMLGAQRAASGLTNVIISEQEAAGNSLVHQVGLVTFSKWADTVNSLTTEISVVQDELWQLDVDGGTAMAAGLERAIAQFDTSSEARRMIVLLSDGLPNIGQNFLDYFFSTQDEETIKQEVLDLANQAGEQGICVYTIGFGNPQADPDTDAYIDETFLLQVAQASGCGQYYSAQESIQLANIFVEIRHASMGTLIMQQSGIIQQNQTLNLGDVNVSADYEQLMFTLNWPGSNLVPVLKDPKGKIVDVNYSGVTIDTQETITTIIVERPSKGTWNVSIYGQDIPQGTTYYNALMSTRGLIEEESEISIWLWVVLVLVLLSIVLIVIFSRSSTQKHGPYQTKQHQPIGKTQRACLQVMDGEQAGTRFLLNNRSLIGRSSQCEIVLQDISVSRMHAIIFFEKEHWFIQDHGSKAGVQVNGRLVERAQIRSGDIIKLGHSELLFLVE
jgi:hypothetical protein